MHRIVRQTPADGYRYAGLCWRFLGALRDVGIVCGRWEWIVGWERYEMPQRAERWWYWVIVLAMLLGCAWLVAVGRP